MNIGISTAAIVLRDSRTEKNIRYEDLARVPIRPRLMLAGDNCEYAKIIFQEEGAEEPKYEFEFIIASNKYVEAIYNDIIKKQDEYFGRYFI